MLSTDLFAWCLLRMPSTKQVSATHTFLILRTRRCFRRLNVRLKHYDAWKGPDSKRDEYSRMNAGWSGSWSGHTQKYWLSASAILCAPNYCGKSFLCDRKYL